MPLIEWQSTFILGIDEFDTHHKHLVWLLNTAYDNYNSGASRDALGLILDELIDYTVYHFGCEELWMDKLSYPVFSEHKDEHSSFKTKILNFRDDFHSGNIELSSELLAFLLKWLSDHILVTDAKYARYYQSYFDISGV